jgi:hypothetical protein
MEKNYLKTEKLFNYVYKITSKIDGKIYVGVRSCNCNMHEDNYLGSGIALKRAIKKYGKEFFTKEILFNFSTNKEAFLKEAELVNEEFVLRKDTFNLSVGGCGGSGPASCKTKESHLISVQKTANVKRGMKCPKQSSTMKGRTRPVGMKRCSRLSGLQRAELYNLFQTGKSLDELCIIFAPMSRDGVRGAISRYKTALIINKNM